jgi:hypothetical protein
VRARIAASVVLAAVLLLSTTACTFFATQATLKHYDPSDGVGATIGDINVRNALLLTKDGQEASFLVNLINDGQNAESVLIQYQGTDSHGTRGKIDVKVSLDAGEVKTFGSKDTRQLIFNGIGTEPGALFPVWIQYGQEPGKQLLVPVLDGSLAEYANLLPTPTPTPTPTVTVTPTPTPSPSASQ